MKINKKLILLSTISISILSIGCSSKTITVQNSEVTSYRKAQLESVQLEQVDRKNSFLSVPKLESVEEVKTTPSISSWKSKTSSNNSTVNECTGDKCMATFIKPKKAIKESDIVVGDEPITPADDPYFASTETVQVGAFRNFVGAQSYAKRYSLLSNQHSVLIKQEMKDSEPIYRVQVNGFTSQEEAENFINRYGSEGAFFVRK